jgi:flagellar hook-length control protein FliK
MQTPSILQQISPSNSQINKNSEFKNTNLKSNNETSSPFKKVLNNEVNNQNKISSQINKKETSNTNKNEQSINENKTIDEEQREDNSIIISNQNILTFVGDIEQLKDTSSLDTLNNKQLLSDDNLKEIQAINAENIAPAPEDNINHQDKILNKNIKVLTQTKILSEKNNLIAGNPIEKITPESKNDNTIFRTNTPTIPILTKDLEIGKVSLLTDEKSISKTSKNNSNFSMEAILKSTPEIANKFNSNMKIELNTKIEVPSFDLKDLTSTNLNPKIEVNLTHQLGISPDQLKANGIANYIPSQLGTKAWDQAMGQRIIWMVAGGEQSAQITLNPPDLGPLQIVLKISDNQVDASFISSHLDVRETLESAMPKLRQMMDDAGIQLSGFSVSSQASQSGQNFTQENSSPKARKVDNSQESNLLSADNSPPKMIKKELGLVDTFV